MVLLSHGSLVVFHCFSVAWCCHGSWNLCESGSVGIDTHHPSDIVRVCSHVVVRLAGIVNGDLKGGSVVPFNTRIKHRPFPSGFILLQNPTSGRVSTLLCISHMLERTSDYMLPILESRKCVLLLQVARTCQAIKLNTTVLRQTKTRTNAILHTSSYLHPTIATRPVLSPTFVLPSFTTTISVPRVLLHGLHIR